MPTSIVREGFLEPGLMIISSESLLEGVLDIYSEYNWFLARNVYALYLNRAGAADDDKRLKCLYTETFQYLDNVLSQCLERVVLVGHDESPARVIHEILHDVIDLSSREYPDTFRQLVEAISNYRELDTRLAELCFYFAGFVAGDFKGYSKIVKEFAPKFFSGQLLESHSELDHQNYRYLLDNTPDEVKKLFYDLGLIWPINNSYMMNKMTVSFNKRVSSSAVGNKRKAQSAKGKTQNAILNTPDEQSSSSAVNSAQNKITSSPISKESGPLRRSSSEASSPVTNEPTAVNFFNSMLSQNRDIYFSLKGIELQINTAQRNITFALPSSEKAFTLYSGGAMSKPIAQQQPRAWAQAPDISHGNPAIPIVGNHLTVSTLNQNQLTLNGFRLISKSVGLNFFPLQESAFLGNVNYTFPELGGIK